MKRIVFILLFIVLLAFSASAMTVELISPAGDSSFEDVGNKVLICQVSKEADEEIDNISLYFENNESVSWHANITEYNPPAGSQIEFNVSDLQNATYNWNCLAVNNNSVEAWDSSNRSFSITFTPPNTAPILSQNIPDMTWPEDIVNSSLNLSEYFTDSDDDSLTFSVVLSPSNIVYSVYSNGTVFLTPYANWSGNTSIIFRASDGTSTVDSNPISLNVSAVNDAPLLSSIIPNKTWNKDTTTKINLYDYFEDIEDSDSSLTFNYSFSSSSPNINITIKSDGDAVLTPDSGWTGSEKVKFSAYDSEGLGVESNEIVLNVKESSETNTTNITNQRPVIDSYLPESNPSIIITGSQTFTITKSDPNGDSLSVFWYVDGLIQENSTSDSFVYTAYDTGSFLIKVVVSDGSLNTSRTWTLTVKPKSLSGNATLGNHAESTSQVNNQEDETAICGDGKCTGDETATECCRDCGCPEGFKCSLETDLCTKISKSNNLMLLIIISSLLLIGVGIILFLYKRNQEKEIFGLEKMPFQIPPKKIEQSSSKAKEKEADEGLFVEESSLKEQNNLPNNQISKSLKTQNTTNQILLKRYIIYNLKKGKPFEKIRKELIKVGWSEEQIKDAYTAAKLEEAFS